MVVDVERHPAPPVALTSCEHEQIHIPGSVQNFGSLLAFDNNYVITRVSENLHKVHGTSAESWIGKPLAEWLHPRDFERVKRATADAKQTIVRLNTFDNKEFYGLAHYLAEETFFDILEEKPSRLDSMQAVRKFVGAITLATTQHELAQIIAEQIRAIAGYDRVKVYKFDDNWNGEVIAESRSESVPSYKGLHFPEGDIPKQARELYIRNRVRVIADVNDVQSTILQKKQLKPLDMSFSFIRSVSPIHLQYLRNMDVVASMSISVFEGGKFWGLIACHHYSPRTFDWEEESLFQTISELASARLLSLKSVQDSADQQRTLSYLQNIVNKNSVLEPKDFLEGAASLDKLVSATGTAICISDMIYKKDATPDDATLKSLIIWLERGVETVFQCDDLPSRFGESIGNYACGLLAAKVPGLPKTWLLWFRMEIIQEVAWAGDPYTPKTSSEFGERLYPRTSFAIWKETKRGHSLAWRAAEIQAAEQLANVVVSLPKISEFDSSNSKA